jgi:predicted protein tyrosine phosphatase
MIDQRVKNDEMKIKRGVEHKSLTFEYSRITKYIFIGTNMCCQAHLDKALARKRIKSVISLDKHMADKPIGVDYYLWLPTRYRQALSPAKLRMGAAFLKETISQKTKCYIHCKHGHGRAPTLVAAFLVSDGMSTNDAFALIKEKSPDIHPNKKQIEMVSNFEKMYKKYMGELLFT